MLKNLSELFRYDELIKTLVSRNLKVRYRGSILGYVWSLLDPLMSMFVFIVVFDVLFKSNVKYYPVFLLCGLIPWTFFQNTVNSSVDCITSNVGLIKRVYYPREIFPLTVTLSNLVNMFLSFLVLIPVLVAFGLPITAKLLLVPVVTLFLFLFALGLGLIFSCLNVFMRDTRQIAPFLVRLWFFVTPIFYAVENRVPERLMDIYMTLNPMAVLLTLFRSLIMPYTYPKPEQIGVAMGVSIATFMVGYSFFKKNEDNMVKSI